MAGRTAPVDSAAVTLRQPQPPQPCNLLLAMRVMTCADVAHEQAVNLDAGGTTPASPPAHASSEAVVVSDRATAARAAYQHGDVEASIDAHKLPAAEKHGGCVGHCFA